MRVQPELLYERVKKCFEGIEVIDAYRSIFRGSSDDEYKVIFQKCERSTLNEQRFWGMRLAIFENRKLTLEILRLMADQGAMEEASALIKERSENNMK